MLDTEKLAFITKRSKAEFWPYPQTFEALKGAGVKTHEVWVENFYSLYKNGSEEWVEPALPDFRPLKSTEEYNEEAFLKALARRINKETTYVGFLTEIAAAGIFYYKVDMDSRTVTYWNKDHTKSYVQHVPPVA